MDFTAPSEDVVPPGIEPEKSKKEKEVPTVAAPVGQDTLEAPPLLQRGGGQEGPGGGGGRLRDPQEVRPAGRGHGALQGPLGAAVRRACALQARPRRAPSSRPPLSSSRARGGSSPSEFLLNLLLLFLKESTLFELSEEVRVTQIQWYPLACDLI